MVWLPSSKVQKGGVWGPQTHSEKRPIWRGLFGNGAKLLKRIGHLFSRRQVTDMRRGFSDGQVSKNGNRKGKKDEGEEDLTEEGPFTK